MDIAEPAHLPEAASCPAFLITLDSEGDNVWARPREGTTRNAAYLGRFQQLCERYGQRPTWLANHEMASDPVFCEFAQDLIARDAGEIGMHLHAWDSPPLVPLTSDDRAAQPYLIEHSTSVMREKVHALTATLEDVFGVKMVSHRAGRWGLDERYARILVAEGYRVDCSVTPLVSWRTKLGDPAGQGGPDYRDFPKRPYWLDLADISRPGDSPLLEVPVTIVSRQPRPVRRLVDALQRVPPRLAPLASFGRRAVNRLIPPAIWLRPTGRNARDLVRIIRQVAASRAPCAEFMLHSSELMPGGSPTFPTARSIERLYADLDVLFAEVRRLDFRGSTLADFYDDFRVAQVEPRREGSLTRDR